MTVTMSDGKEHVLTAGNVYYIGAGHDAIVTEDLTGYEFSQMHPAADAK